MADQPKGYFQRCLDGMTGCAKSSTAHGVNHVANSGHVIIRSFWLLAFAAGTGIFLYHFYTLLDRFWQNPVSIVVNYRVVEFQFPEVTFCPLLPFSIRVLEKKQLLSQLATVSDVEQLERLMELARLPLDNFILDCNFYGENCTSAGKFYVVEDPRYKHCYTFTPNNRNPRSTAPQNALRVVLFAESVHPHLLEQTVGIKLLPEWQTSGVRVVIHPPKTHPHPESRGVDVPPGTSTQIGLTISRIEQLKDCEHRESTSVCDPHNQTRVYNFSFTKEDCYAERVQELMVEKCDCLSDNYAFPANLCSDNKTKSYREVCSSTPEMWKCQDEELMRINSKFADNIITKCPYVCNETHWHTSLFSTAWPSEFAEKQVLGIFEEVHARLTALKSESYLDEYKREIHGENFNKLAKNLAHISVYAKVLTGNAEVQERAYPIISLLGEVGGILGLWLGCSVLTFFEPMELLLHAVTPFCMRQVAAIQQKSEQLRAAMEERTAAFRSAVRTQPGRGREASFVPAKREPPPESFAREEVVAVVIGPDGPIELQTVSGVQLVLPMAVNQSVQLTNQLNQLPAAAVIEFSIDEANTQNYLAQPSM